MEIGGLSKDIEFLSPHHSSYYDEAGQGVRRLLKTLMEGWSEATDADEPSILSSYRIFKAIFFQYDAELACVMRGLLQEAFKHVHRELASRTYTTGQLAQIELYISNCLCILPHADLTPHEFISIPLYVNDAWVLVDYKVSPIELTPTHGYEKLCLSDARRVFAYGLEPIDCKDADPHILFMGTNYPAGPSFGSQIVTNLQLGTPGERLYASGRGRLSNFLDKQVKAGKKTHVHGMSLGGALSMLLAIDQGEKLSRVDALNPPGLYNPFFKSPYDNWDVLVKKKLAPRVYVQKQGDDLIPTFGVWKKEFRVLDVKPHKSKQGPSWCFDHALNYAGLRGTRFTFVDVEADNATRSRRDPLVYLGLRACLFYPFILPYYFVIKPLFEFFWARKFEFAVVLIPFMIQSYLPVAVFVLMAAFSVTLAVSTLGKAIVYALEVIQGVVEPEPLYIHTKEAPRVPELMLHKHSFYNKPQVNEVELEERINTNVTQYDDFHSYEL